MDAGGEPIAAGHVEDVIVVGLDTNKVLTGSGEV